MQLSHLLLSALAFTVGGPSAERAPDPCADHGLCAVQIGDPGTGPWVSVPDGDIAEVCRLDPELLSQVTPPDGASFAVVRDGRLCFVSGEDGSDGPAVHHVFSVTKTLGALLTGVAMYETRHLPPSDLPMTGPLREFDRVEKWLDLGTLPEDARIHPDATVAHVLAMVGYSESLDHGQKSHLYDTRGNREINHLIPLIDNVVRQDPARFGANAVEVKDRFFEKLGLEHSSWDVTLFGYSWYGSLLDMARVGSVILNGGVYNGERLVDARYVYNMTHPAFEDGSTRYGYLTWMNNLSCAPRAIHASYPHGLSGARDCEDGDCAQEHDVGAWSALGAQGQFILGHRGLDLLVVGQNWGQAGGDALWRAVLPAIVAADPVYQGDQEAFCAAYGANAYAPDLRLWEGDL